MKYNYPANSGTVHDGPLYMQNKQIKKEKKTFAYIECVIFLA